MIFSFNKLSQLANLPQNTDVKEVVQAMNSIGFEVENYKKFTDLENIKFGKVMNVSQNPNGDKLNICQIKFDDKERTIQTTAPNVKQGMTVIAFIPGSRSGTITFESKELKGVVSEGMLTNLTEFGLSEEYLRDEWKTNIADFPMASIKHDPIEFLELDDYIIDADILSNRSDAASYYVMAKELAAYFKTSPNIPEVKHDGFKSELEVENNIAESLVFLEAKNIDQISIQEQILLAKHGIKSINDGTDLSNLSLIYSGQPTHSYDRNFVNGFFKVAKVSGKYDVFGNKNVNLDNNLVILNNKEIVSIASVIGLEKYKITPSTKNIIFEMGIFPSQEIRKSAKTIKLSTNASQQGSKKLSIGLTLFSLAYLTNRLEEYSLPINLEIPKELSLSYNPEELFKIAGADLSNDKKYLDAISALEILGFSFNNNEVKIPLYRHDITSQQDLNEEILRFYGYDNLKEQAMMVQPTVIKDYVQFKHNISSQGYQEVKSYTLTSSDQNHINPFQFKKTVKLETQFTSERSEVRNSQSVSLQDIAEYNTKRKINNINLFSQGMINNGIKTWAMFSNTKDFHTMQQELVNLIGNVEFKRHDLPELHPNYSALIFKNDKQIGWIGKIHPQFQTVDGIYIEFINDDYLVHHEFHSYDNSPLKITDHNILLNKHEDIKGHLSEFKNSFDVEVIDTYETGDNLKVTVKVAAKK